MPTRARFDLKKSNLNNLALTNIQMIKIKALIYENPNANEFLEALSKIYFDFKVWDSIDKPSSTEMRANAEAIVRDISSLRKKLSKGAGGLKYRFDSTLFKASKHKVVNSNLLGLNNGLEELEMECIRFINIYNAKLITNTSAKPKQIFAKELAELFKNVLNEKPSDYVPVDLSTQCPVDNRKGKFARMLVVLFNSQQSIDEIVGNAKK